ncbi:hypothetical protein ACUY3R_04420 [Corynebacterium sp. 23_3061]|uniref:hypothetical protein n=1 Tax=Corynebacterium TaxID=1716 RepID=UPI00195944EF|nr:MULTISPECIES: hypothetical protein [Corynebacterium]QRQ65776.1 hypothetical protein I6J23_05025 [Corynebacterium kroppenstedtii]
MSGIIAGKAYTDRGSVPRHGERPVHIFVDVIVGGSFGKLVGYVILIEPINDSALLEPPGAANSPASSGSILPVALALGSPISDAP